MSKSPSKSPSGFEDFCLNPRLIRGVADAGFVSPRPIQVQTIPAILEGRDILGLAQTGTGKTAAFALPILEHLLLERPQRGPRVLIVAPTRELAIQISEEIQTLAKFTGLKTITIFGGVPPHFQINLLRGNPDIVVGCPGRLLDLHQQRMLPLDGIRTLVLDEADHMFDMGFLPDIRRIIAAVPNRRQTLLFSATMPQEIRVLAEGILHDPHAVDLNKSRPVSTVEHVLYPVDDRNKFSLLQHLCSAEDFVSAIVFTRTRYRAKRLAQRLSRDGFRAVALQGNMSQVQRVHAMEGFRQRQFDILVATDIAARGIDVHQVSHVVNFDMPSTVDAYTHRIGRTGRSERHGKAYTLIVGDDLPLVDAVERRIGARIPRKTIEGLEPADFSGRPLEAGRQPRPKPGKSRLQPRSRRRVSRGVSVSTARRPASSSSASVQDDEAPVLGGQRNRHARSGVQRLS